MFDFENFDLNVLEDILYFINKVVEPGFRRFDETLEESYSLFEFLNHFVDFLWSNSLILQVLRESRQ